MNDAETNISWCYKLASLVNQISANLLKTGPGRKLHNGHQFLEAKVSWIHNRLSTNCCHSQSSIFVTKRGGKRIPINYVDLN